MIVIVVWTSYSHIMSHQVCYYSYQFCLSIVHSGVLANNFQETDFGEIAEEDRSRNFVKRGGTQQPDSPEKLAQEHREAITLMVFYTSPEEVPPSPKEPPSPSPTETVPEEVPFGEPPDYIKVSLYADFVPVFLILILDYRPDKNTTIRWSTPSRHLLRNRTPPMDRISRACLDYSKTRLSSQLSPLSLRLRLCSNRHLCLILSGRSICSVNSRHNRSRNCLKYPRSQRHNPHKVRTSNRFSPLSMPRNRCSRFLSLSLNLSKLNQRLHLIWQPSFHSWPIQISRPPLRIPNGKVPFMKIPSANACVNLEVDTTVQARSGTPNGLK